MTRLPLGAAIVLSAALVPDLLAAPAESSAIRFVEQAAEAGIVITTTNGDLERRYIIDTLGSGAALFDFDLDGDLDLYVANGSRLEPAAGSPPPLAALYRNEGGRRFTDVTAASGLAQPFWGFGVASGDYDNDGDPDLYVTAWGRNRLFRNNGDGTFSDVAVEAGVGVERFGTSAAFFDYDADGALDLYVANYVTFDPAKIPARGDPDSPCTFRGLTVMCGPHGLPGAVDALFHNNGDGTFTDVTRPAGLLSEGGFYGLGVIAADIDRDGRVDILVANDSTPNHFYRNLGDGAFSDDALMAGFAYSSDGREQAGMGIDAGDIDNDQDPDVFITNFSHDYSTLRINDGAGFLEDISVRVGLVEATISTLGWGALMVDLDNDGDLDLFLANGHVYPEVEQADIGTTYRQRNQILENLGGLRFREVPTQGPRGAGAGRVDLHRGLAGGDVDLDGDVDLVVTVLDGRPELLVNEAPQASWLAVRLIGRASNRDGTGAKVTVRSGGRSWTTERRGGGSYLSSSDPRVHFGLGDLQGVDRVEIHWPSGIRQTIASPPINTVLVALEPAGKPASGKSDPP